MNTRTVFTIFRKEILDMVRDRRTLIAMVAVPVVLYPALFLAASQAIVVQRDRIEAQPSRVALHGPAVSITAAWLDQSGEIEIIASTDPERELLAGFLDAVVTAPESSANALQEGGAMAIEVWFDATESRSAQAAQRVQEALNEARDRLVAERAEAAGLSLDYVNPLDVETENRAPAAKTAGAILGLILPVLMVVMLGVGAFYPAVDLTAGEKERGTFEALLSTPASKLEILTGKFLTVFSLSLCTGLLNLASMLATFALQLGQLEAEFGEMTISFPPHTAITILFALIPLAFFISAMMMSVAVLARSFKEAQNFVTPFFFLITLPPALAAMPGTDLGPITQFLPIANVALLFKELMTASVPAETIFAVLFSTTIYALLGLLAATWIFQREDVILSQERGIPLTINRRHFKRMDLPTPGLALLLYVFCLLLLFYVGSYAQSRNIFVGLLITQWLLLLLPTLAVLLYVRVNIRTALALRLPPAKSWPPFLLLMPAWMVLIIQFGVWHNEILPVPEEMERYMRSLFDPSATGLGLPAMLLILALTPAICEEALFRGAMLSGLRQRLAPWAAVLVTGLLFGLFHLSIFRILPTALSGVLLGYLVLRGRSLLPGVAGHFIINASAVLILAEALPDSLLYFFIEQDVEQQGFPWWVLAPACAVFAVSAAWYHRVCRPAAGPEGVVDDTAPARE